MESACGARMCFEFQKHTLYELMRRNKFIFISIVFSLNFRLITDSCFSQQRRSNPWNFTQRFHTDTKQDTNLRDTMRQRPDVCTSPWKGRNLVWGFMEERGRKKSTQNKSHSIFMQRNKFQKISQLEREREIERSYMAKDTTKRSSLNFSLSGLSDG